MILLVACAAPSLTVVLSPTDAHAAHLTLDGAGTVDCVGGGETHRLAVDGSATARGLLADTAYTCVAEVEGEGSPPVTVETPPLPDTLRGAEVVVPGDPAEIGFHLVNVAWVNDAEGALTEGLIRDPFLVVLDAEGRPRWQYAGVGGADTDATWLGSAVLFGGYGGEQAEAPTIIDLDGRVRTTAVPSVDSTWNTPGEWTHDAGISEDGASIWALELEAVPDPEHPESTWEGFTVERIDPSSGETEWAWSANDDGVAGGWLEAGRAADSAPFHPNAVWDADDRLYVSLRNEDAVIAVDPERRAVLWRLGEGGDFTLLDADGAPSEDWFHGQHDVKVIGDRVLVYDNGYGGPGRSRALELLLDEAARTARITLSWEGEGWYTPAWGGLDTTPEGDLDLAIGVLWWANPGVDDRSALVRLRPDGEGGAEERWRIELPDRERGLYRSDTIDGCAAFDVVEYCPGRE